MKSRIIILTGILLMTFGFISCKAEVEEPAPTPEPEPQATYYTVTYSSEHGTAPGAISVEENTILTESQLPALSDGTWVFKGWYVNNVKAVAGEYQVAGNVTLTAHWAATATVSYHSKFGTVPQSFDKELNQTLAEENLNAMTCSPYTFLGWFYDKDDDDNGTGIQAQAGDEISADLPLYAKWQTATVSFTSAYGTVPSIKKYTGQKLASSEIPVLRRTGYSLDGWFNGSTKLTTDYTVTDDVVFTAKWTGNTYTITFKANGGTGSDYTQTVTYGTTAKLNANIFSRNDGYVFDGWNKNADGSGTSFEDNADFAVTEANDVTLYAQWTPAADETTIVNMIRSMRESGTIAAKGTFDQSLINSIIYTLKNSMQPNVFVKLDLSQVTGLTSIGFSNCKRLSGIILPNTITQLNSGAFSSASNLTEIILPNNIESIPDRTFEGCTSLTTLTIPNSVKSIGESAFKGCSSLTNITISRSQNIESISDSTFEGCTSLTTVTIPNSVKSIGVSAFKGCSSLSRIIIPENVSQIKKNAFSDCTKLKRVFFWEDTKVWYAYENYQMSGFYDEIVGKMNDSEEEHAERLTIDYVDYYLKNYWN